VHVVDLIARCRGGASPAVFRAAEHGEALVRIAALFWPTLSA
jgi:hypothetical protein